MSNFQKKSVTKIYGSTLLALRGVDGVKFPEKSVTKTYTSTLLPLRGVDGVKFPGKKALHLNGPLSYDFEA